MKWFLLWAAVPLAALATPEVVLRPGGEGVFLVPNDATEVRCEAPRPTGNECDVSDYSWAWYVYRNGERFSVQFNDPVSAIRKLNEYRKNGLCD